MDASTNISPEEGYCQAEKSSSDKNKDIFTFCYYDQDHLGNIRQVREANGSKGYVIQTMNYYPFGAEFCDGSANTSVQKHKYNGKEFDKMHGLNTYDYGARQHDPILGRWDRIDPLCEKYYSTSPYNYAGNNPICKIDIDGLYEFDSNVEVKNNNNYSFIAFFQSKQTVDNDETLAEDRKAAIEAGVPIVYVDDLDDFENALGALKDNKTSFENATLYSHGDEDGFCIGDTYVNDWTIYTKMNSEDGYNNIKNEFKDKNVVLSACFVGQNDTFLKNFADYTQSTVYAAWHGVPKGISYDGKTTMNGLDINKNRMQYRQNKYTMASSLSGTPQTVYNLSLSTKGVSFLTKAPVPPKSSH